MLYQRILAPFRITVFLLIGALVVIGLSCSENDVTPPSAKAIVIGTVFLEDSDLTIPKVAVNIGDQSCKTVTNGEYRLTDVPVGTHTLIATKGGYETYSVDINVNTAVTEHNIRLWRIQRD